MPRDDGVLRLEDDLAGRIHEERPKGSSPFSRDRLASSIACRR